MPILTLKSRAKVNLALDVLEREPSGYHRIQTIFHEVEKPYDTLIFEEVSEARIWLEPHYLGACRGIEIPINETNTILRAARLLQKEYGLKEKGMRIIVEKRIPMRSGLGGASANAAATLSALNTLWNLQLPMKKLLAHAGAIGMDVPFFMYGGCALGMHYGDHLMPLPTLDTLGFAIEIIPAKKEVSTPEAYAKLDLTRCGKNAQKTSTLVKILKGEKPIDPKNVSEIIESLLHNDFETAHSVPAKNYKLKTTSFPPHLSGSGGWSFRLKKLNTPSSPPARSSG